MDDVEYKNPKQGPTKTFKKLKCKHCGSTWFESKAIMGCEFLLNDDSAEYPGILLSAAEKSKEMVGLPIYYRCLICSKLTEVSKDRTLSWLNMD